MELGKKTKIYIIDDDEVLLNMYSIKFRNAGFDVEVSKDGYYALDKLRSGYVPDVILLDVIMPGIDGLELLKNMRQDGLVPSAIVVVLSNENSPDEIIRAKELNIAGYIVKATTIPSEVVVEVQNILKARAK